MNIHHLKYFHDAAQRESLTESARINHVTHSAVSQAIRSLERTLGVPLLAHRKNRFLLTQEGKLLQQRCGEVFSLVKRIQVEVADAKTELAGPLFLAASRSMTVSLLPGFISRFVARYPRAEVNLLMGDARRVRELVAQQKADVGLLVDDGQSQDFERITACQGRFVLAASRRRKSGEDIPRFLVGDKGAEVLEFRRAVKKRPALRAIPFMEIESWDVIASLAAYGMGSGYIPDFMLDDDGTNRLEIVDLALPEFEFGVCIIHRSSQELSKVQRRCIDELREHLMSR